ncbi:MAG TPA: protein kinase [Actinomycetota bacterium]|nr:protein kinase [Actinomycetota bacterium]
MVKKKESTETRVLGGRYRVVETIASGGMGTVFRALDERLGREVAIKVLKPELAHDDRFVERFKREARAAGALSHPNIAGIYDFGDDDDEQYIVMELVRGRDLGRVLREDGKMSPGRAAGVAGEIAAALGHAHAAGLVHRDVKPANILIDDGGRTKVTDFGIARATGDSRLTVTGTILGTSHYISPEQARGEEAVPASDVYSLGIVLYELLTGAVPYTAESPVGVAMRHVTEDVPPPSELNPEVPPDLDDVVARATARDPGTRYHDGREMAAGLGRALSGDTAELETTSASTQAVWPIPGDRWDPQKVGRRVLAILAGLALLAVALLLIRVASTDRGEDSSRRDREGPRARASQQADPNDGPTNLQMPGLVGEYWEDAAATLKAQGFEVVPTGTPSEELEEGLVVITDPPPGATLVDGATITLFVSTGPEDDDEEHPGKGDEKKPEKDKPQHDDDD